MFVHIGNNIVLEEKDIIGIYNIESMRESEEYKNLIESLKKTNNLVTQANGDARSLIMTKEENGKIVGYETNVSTMSIAKRAEDKKKNDTLLGGFSNGKI